MDKIDTVEGDVLGPGWEDPDDPGCPILGVQKIISGKYKARIIWDLQDGPRRYSEIRRSLKLGSPAGREIAPRVLSRELKALTDAGLIARKDFAVVPPHVEYRLTAPGKSFLPIIRSIRKWGERHLSAAPA